MFKITLFFYMLLINYCHAGAGTAGIGSTGDGSFIITLLFIAFIIFMFFLILGGVAIGEEKAKGYFENRVVRKHAKLSDLDPSDDEGLIDLKYELLGEGAWIYKGGWKNGKKNGVGTLSKSIQRHEKQKYKEEYFLKGTFINDNLHGIAHLEIDGFLQKYEFIPKKVYEDGTYSPEGDYKYLNEFYEKSRKYELEYNHGNCTNGICYWPDGTKIIFKLNNYGDPLYDMINYYSEVEIISPDGSSIKIPEEPNEKVDNYYYKNIIRDSQPIDYALPDILDDLFLSYEHAFSQLETVNNVEATLIKNNSIKYYGVWRGPKYRYTWPVFTEKRIIGIRSYGHFVQWVRI